ncbi:hypothetical protein O181_129950 [Austropuccinia psidii MF-1]|uniref:Uncharacterized protein n=1 Tax=Austropuccinia psidii MF-1 TaxID=1389203 RepID=A0A9Q3KY29_9BASI|nr:hypothetical protein [Austropuccinia psidii MF-1]
MPVQHRLPTKNTRCKRNHAVLTPTERAPLECTPSVDQLSANLDRGPPMEGSTCSRRGDEEAEYSEEAEVSGSLEDPGAPNPALFNLNCFSQAEPNLLKNMSQMNQLMGQLTEEATARDNSRAPEFKTSSMKVPDSLYGTQAHKSRVFI